jgi:hypothetical protein
MSGINEFLIFDENNQNTLSNESYSIDTQRLNGVGGGIARSNLYNKAMRQATMLSFTLGQIISENDGNATENAQELKESIKNKVLNSQYIGVSNEVNSKLSVNNVDKALIKLSQNNEEVADNSLHIITIQEWKSWSITVNELKQKWENDAYDLSKIPTDRGKIFNLIFDTEVSCDFRCGDAGFFRFYGYKESTNTYESLYSEYKYPDDGENGVINFSTTTIWNNAGTAFVFYSETSNDKNIIVDYIRNKNTIKKIIFDSSSAGRTTKPTKIRTRVRAVVVG